MAAEIEITVEDIAAKLAEGYTTIELHSAATLAGVFSLVDTATLGAGVYYYTIEDPSGSFNTWYKYRYVGSATTGYSDPFQLDGITRLKIRQKALSTYRAGIDRKSV